jgi:hypothetical protein
MGVGEVNAYQFGEGVSREGESGFCINGVCDDGGNGGGCWCPAVREIMGNAVVHQIAESSLVIVVTSDDVALLISGGCCCSAASSIPQCTFPFIWIGLILVASVGVIYTPRLHYTLEMSEDT